MAKVGCFLNFSCLVVHFVLHLIFGHLIFDFNADRWNSTAVSSNVKLLSHSKVIMALNGATSIPFRISDDVDHFYQNAAVYNEHHHPHNHHLMETETICSTRIHFGFSAILFFKERPPTKFLRLSKVLHLFCQTLMKVLSWRCAKI